MGNTANAILNILENASEPLTTAQIKRRLGVVTGGRDIYGVLFLLQSSGAIHCTGTGPWRWNMAQRRQAA